LGRRRRMGSRTAGNKRRRRLHALPLLAVSLAMVLASVPALAAPTPSNISEEDTVRPDEDNPAQGPPEGSPVEPPPVGPSEIAPGICEHAPGEFLVGYASVKDLQAAPPENVVETFEGILAQHLAFEEIKNIPDQAKRLAAEEVKKQELLARPGVVYVEYNCIAQVDQATESSSDLRAPASCGDCGRYVVDEAKKIISDGLGGSEDREAFNEALEAARSADDDNVAFASEARPDGEAVTDGGSVVNGDDTNDGASDDTKAQPEGSGVGTEGTAKDAGEEAVAGKSSFEGPEARPKGEYTLTEADAEPVSGKNAAATSRPREMRGSGDGFLTIGAGALLLVAGVFVARRTFGG
jgi:hypothetical protein